MKSEFFNHNSKPSYALMSTISGHGLSHCDTEGMLHLVLFHTLVAMCEYSRSDVCYVCVCLNMCDVLVAMGVR